MCQAPGQAFDMKYSIFLIITSYDRYPPYFTDKETEASRDSNLVGFLVVTATETAEHRGKHLKF